jgi:hypothetical protein
MITEIEYNQAQDVVTAYLIQEELLRQEKAKKRIQEQAERELKCDDHYFIDDGKWSSTRSCTFCGKTI